MLMMRRTLPVVALLWLLAPRVALAQGGSISREEALSGAFPGAVIEAVVLDAVVEVEPVRVAPPEVARVLDGLWPGLQAAGVADRK